MNERSLDTGILAAGFVFVTLGVLFLLNSLDIVQIDPGYIWPVVLICLGVAVLFGGWHARRQDGR
jgi:hypothetical protein